ncbi:MAG TPA: hypothetical protein C5S37_10030 [Methanophagales archaeon]|nr:hypothetical protein [Methanophagales archaeon]
MKVKIKHLALSISVAVVLLCVFAGVIGIASVKTIPVPNDYPAMQQVIGTTYESGDTGFDSDIAIVNDTAAAHLAKTALWYRKHADDTEHLYGENVKRFKKGDNDKIYALDVVPHAQFTLEKNFGVGTEDDFIMSGTQECKKRYWLDIYNYDDASDTVLGNLSFSAKAENITGVDWKRYADWNESFVKWEFPPHPKFTIEEDEGFGTWIKTISEDKYINVDVSRAMNKTKFNSSGYQLAEFNVTFKDVDFLWCWGGGIEANEHEEVSASIVPGTFETDAPIKVDWEQWDHGLKFDFDRAQIETNVTYNFSVVIRVELKKAPPIEYKPRFKIGQGLNESRQLGGEGHYAEISPEMLPEKAHKASACTNVSNNWDLRRVDHRIVKLKEVVELVGPHAEFHFNKDFNVWTRNDTLASGTYERNKWYWMHIENMKDTSGAALSNLSFGARADNITDVDWGKYAKWNESYVEWNFPLYPMFIIDENEGFGTGFGRGSETRDVNVSVGRWMNKTKFNSSAYQLAKFNVTFDDTNFEWVWAQIEANERHEIEASIVLGTFTFDAPLGDFDVWDQGVHFNFNKSAIETGVTYNFSVIVNVKPTGKEAPPILYKPQFSIGKGLYYNSTTGTGYKIEIPSEMLPEYVYNASASTNVSNAWLIKRHNHIIVGLEEVVELPGPHALFSTDNVFPVETENDTIYRGTYERNMWCRLNIKNSDDTSDTVFGDLRFCGEADNITAVHWEEHAVWNKTSVSWTFPSDFVIYEDDWFGTGFGTNHTEVRHLSVGISRQMNLTRFNDSAYQSANFTVTFEDANFQWCGGRIEANEHYEVNASIVPSTFESDAPLDWFNEWEHGVRFGFDRDALETGVAYNFSALVKVNLTGNRAPPIVYKPLFFINVELEKSFAPGGEGVTVEMPAEMLPSYVNNASVTTNISNNWTLRQVNRTIAKLEEVYGSTRIEAVFYDGYLNPLPAMPNVTSSTGVHEYLKLAGAFLANPTSASILSPSISLKTKDPIIDYNIESRGVKEFSYEYVAENASRLNWSLYDVPPHIQQHEGYGSLVIMSKMESKDHGFNASVSVDKYEFSTPSEQNLNITIDVYDNSSMEILLFETHTPDFDFISADFINWSSDIPPEYFEPWRAHWWIENPEERRYTFSIKLNVTLDSPCVYRPGVNVFNWNMEETLVNSSSEVVESTSAGNYTISIGETHNWTVIKTVFSGTEFPWIAVENYTTISGYVKDDNGNPIENTLVFVNIWNESEYQDYVETSTNESGYYKAYVKSDEKYEIIAGWMRPDYMTEEIEDVTITQPHIQNFTLHNASVVCGGVFDAGKKSMQGVKVTIASS